MADLTLVRNALLRRDVALLLAAIGLIIIAIGGFYFGGQSAAVDRDPPELAADARNQSLRWVDAAAALRRGDTVDWAALTAPSDDLTSRLQALRDTAASSDNESVEALGRAWSALQASGTALAEHAEAYQRVLQQLGEIRAQLSDIGTATAALSDELTAQSAPARQLQLATQLMMRLERVNAALPTVVGTGTNASQNIEALRLESAYFVNDLTRLTGGDDNLPALRDGATRDRATALQQRYQTVADRIGVIVEAAPRMDALQQHAADIPAHAAAVIAAADALQVWPGPQSDPHAALPVVSVLALVLAIAAILLIINTVQVAAFTRRTEVSIMRLVGATRWYTQLPFLLEAVVSAFVGSMLAIGGLLLAKKFFFDNALRELYGVSFFARIELTDVLFVAPWLVLGGIVLAGATAYVTLRVYVRE